MKKIITAILLFISILSFSQKIKKEYLTKDEIKYLAKDLYLFNEPTIGDYENSTRNNLINYGFDIIYSEKIIYRGAIEKPSLRYISPEYRNHTAFCLDFDLFDLETKLELAENEIFIIGKTEKGKKYLIANSYVLFNIDVNKGLIINDRISEKLKIKFYKIIH